MPKTIARDLLRVSAFIPETSPLIEKVVDRAWWWADDVFVVSDQTLEAETFHDRTMTWEGIWQEFENRLELKEGDYVVWLEPTEILVNSDALRPAIRYNPDKVIGFNRYLMVDEDNYSLYKPPGRVFPVFPYRPGGLFFENILHTLRGPDYVANIPRMAVSATDMLDYRFFTPEGREFYADLYGEPRLRNIHYMATAKWTGGGLL